MEKVLDSLQDFNIRNDAGPTSTAELEATIRSQFIDFIDQHTVKIILQEEKIKEVKNDARGVQLSTEEAVLRLEIIEAEEQHLNELQQQKHEFENSMQWMLRELTTRRTGREQNFLKLSFDMECKHLKAALPIYSKRSDILDAIERNQVTVLTAETGSGKSTQVVQYLYQKYMNEMIVCTQPRKVAAISLAKRVSEEMLSTVGQTVGYSVGAQRKTTEETCIQFVTDHLLLNECLHDPYLSKYKYIIVDEAHERSISTDLLLAMIKKALVCRPEMRLIISSATIDPEVFMKYFEGNAVRLHVRGRVFPVQISYEEVSIGTNYLQVAIDKAKKIHQTEEEGDVLVFLTTPAETEKAQEMIRNDPGLQETVHCLILHGRLPPDEQQAIFEPTPRGQRKIVFATNSAETSITIPNIKYVIDSGMVKEKHYDRERNISLLKVGPVNKSSAIQRKGRAGRTEEGKCFRLFTEEEYNAMVEEMLPEILRENLGIALLKLFQLGIEDPLTYDFVQPPTEDSLRLALEELVHLEAFFEADGMKRLSKYGKIMATLNIEPKLGKFVALAIDEGLSLDAMVVAAICSVGSSVFFRAGAEDNKQVSDRLKVRFCHPLGDMITILEVYKQWRDEMDHMKNQWCIRNSMNAKTLRYTKDMVKEMTTNIEKLLAINIEQAFADPEDVKVWVPLLLAQCFSKHVAFYSGHPRGGYFRPDWGLERFHLHPSSSLSFLSETPKWVLFTEVLTTSRTYIINTTAVPDTIAEAFGLDSKTPNVMEEDKWIVGKATAKKLGFGRWNCNQEKKMQDVISTDIYIDYDQNRGVVTLNSGSSSAMKARIDLQNCIFKERINFQKRLIDIPLSNGNPTSVVLEQGGVCREILEQREFNTILLAKVDENITKEEIEKEFAQYGNISEVIPFKPGNYTWGKIIYLNKSDAVNSLQRVKQCLKFREVKVKPGYRIGQKKNFSKHSFTLKAFWTRRPAKGNFAFISFEEPSHFAEFVGTTKMIGFSKYHFLRSTKKPTDLMVKGISHMVSQQELKLSIENQFPHVKVENCTIPRKEIPMESKEAIDAMQRQLSLHIGIRLNQQDSTKRNFTVEINPLRSDKDYDFEAKISFQHATDSYTINSASDIEIRGSKVRFQIDLQSPPIMLATNVYLLIRDDLQREIRVLPNVKLIVNSPHGKAQGEFEVRAEARDAENLSKAMKRLQEIAFGEEMKFTEDQFRFFLTPAGKEFISNLQIYDSCVITVEQRLRSIRIHGPLRARRIVAAKIEKEQDAMGENHKEWLFDLNKQPSGFLKVVLRQYGTDFKTLYKETSATYININFIGHQIQVIGAIDSLQKAMEILQKLAQNVHGASSSTNSSKDEECPVCLGSLDIASYQLEVCAHSYCKECIQSLCEHAAKNKQLPLACAKQGCDKLICIQDIQEFTEIEQLVPAAIEMFIANNKDDYAYCVSANCLNIYKVSRIRNSEPFHCSVCQEMICTFCQIKYHENVECKISARRMDSSLQEWLDEPNKDRGICPSCSAPIERIDGCNHIACTSCRRHVCWRCKKVSFVTTNECYNHLASCGGIFG